MKTHRLLQLHRLRKAWFRITLFALSALLFVPFAFAEDQSKEHYQEQIQIEADRLTTNDDQKYAEFFGNVRTSQGDFVMVSEALKIYYKKNFDHNKNQPSRQEVIKRVVASGNVKITSDKFTAETHQVEYDLDTMMVVLSGANSTVKRGKNTLTGSKITINRSDGQIKVESSPENRVKAVFYSKEKVSED